MEKAPTGNMYGTNDGWQKENHVYCVLDFRR